MTRIQKIYLGIFIAMFAVPEILFSFLTSLVLFKIDFSSIMFRLMGEQFFLDHQNYIFTPAIIEILGLIGILSYNKKFNNGKYKNFINALLILIIILLLFVFYVSLSLSHGMSI